MHILSLTVDQAVDSAASPKPQRAVDILGCCTSVTTERLLEDHSTSTTSPPKGSAAPGHLPRRTMHNSHTKDTSILSVAHTDTHTHTHTQLTTDRHGINLKYQATSTCTWSLQFSSVMLFYKKTRFEIQKKSK